MSSRTVLERYEPVLREHLRSRGEEETLLHAYEVGRELMQRGLGPIDIARLHTDAVAAIAAAEGADTETRRRADDFLTEVMASFEMAYRGFEEANSRLRALTASLEEQVQQRTSELRDSLSALQAADAERRRLLGRVVSAQEQERHRIADDLHDDIIQVLTAVGMRLSTLSSRVDPAGQPQVARLEATVSEAIGRLRRMLFELRPPALDREGLCAAIRTHLQTALEDIEHTVDDALDTEPPIETREIAYRIAQEALANVRKHALASHVHVTIKTDRDGLRVTVADDGAGFDPALLEDVRRDHFGVAAMRERAAFAGGWCAIDSSIGKGTTVGFWLPLEPPGVGSQPAGP